MIERSITRRAARQVEVASSADGGVGERTHEAAKRIVKEREIPSSSREEDGPEFCQKLIEPAADAAAIIETTIPRRWLVRLRRVVEVMTRTRIRVVLGEYASSDQAINPESKWTRLGCRRLNEEGIEGRRISIGESSLDPGEATRIELEIDCFEALQGNKEGQLRRDTAR